MSNHEIVHIEIPANDPAAAAKFYGDLFGWKLESDSVYNYHMFQPASGPGGGFVQAGTDPSGMVSHKIGEPLIYVGTDDIEATLAKVESLGGRPIVPKTEIPNIGWFAIFTDPSGNKIALYTSKQG